MTGKRYNVDDYDTLEDFLSEYNGSKSPSYESGCDFYHDSFEENLDEIVRETLWNAVYSVNRFLVDQNDDFKTWARASVEESIENIEKFIEELTFCVYNSFELDDFIHFEMYWYLQNLVRNTSLRQLYKNGKKSVLNNMTTSEKEELKLYDSYYDLLEAIRKLNGFKIITIVLNETEYQIFEMEENGELSSNIIVNSRSHYEQFRHLVLEGLKSLNSILLIRQFTPLKIEIETPNGKEMIPIKKIYGIRLKNRTWSSIPASQLESAYCIDIKTDRDIKKELGIVFCTF